MLSGFKNGEAPAFFAGRHEMDGGAVKECVFVILGDLAMEDDVVIGAHVVAEFIFPPAGADDVENHPLGQCVDCMFELFVWDETGQGDDVGVIVSGELWEGGRNGIHTVVDDGDVFSWEAKVDQILAAGCGNRDNGSVAVHAGGHAGFKEPTNTCEEVAGDGPLLTVAMVSEENGRFAAEKLTEERNAILRVNDHIYVFECANADAA